MGEIHLMPLVGTFAENKDIAARLRREEILPILERGEEVVLDFNSVQSATQSFVHALISDLIRRRGAGVLDQMYFKNCNKTVQKIINIVVDYMQESAE